MNLDHLERELRELLHALRRGSDTTVSLTELLSSAPSKSKSSEQAPPTKMVQDFLVFQNLIRISRDRYEFAMPGISLNDDIMPADFESEASQVYFKEFLHHLNHVTGHPEAFRNIMRMIDKEYNEKNQNTSDSHFMPIPVILPLASAIDIFAIRFTDAFKRAAMVVGGVPVTVNSAGAGYTVRFTPRWLFSICAFGSHPTTPVTDHLAPADYRFAGDKHGSLTWDRAIHTVTSPSTTTSVTAF